MLLIQYLQHTEGGTSTVLVFLVFCNSFVVEIAAYSVYFIFFKIFLVQYSFGRGATKLFWLVLCVVDAAYLATKLFFIITFSTSSIRQVAPLVRFSFFFCSFPKKT